MGGILDELKTRVDAVERNGLKGHRLTQSAIVLMNHVNARIDAFLQIGVERGLFSKEEFDQKVDNNLGLRLKAEWESIDVGDVVFVKYTGQPNDGGEVFSDEMPVRVGAQAIVFEPDLIGKRPGQVFTCTHEFPEHKKSINFTIEVLRVKTKIEGVAQDDRDNPGLGSDGSIGAEAPGNNEPQADAGGGIDGTKHLSDLGQLPAGEGAGDSNDGLLGSAEGGDLTRSPSQES